jgi:mRNA-degrading endonuclease toxin of MazEF toxin-antitoxin module
MGVPKLRKQADHACILLVGLVRTIPPQPYPFIVVVEPEESGLPVRSAVNCSQMATIQQSGPASRLRPPRGEAEVSSIGRLSSVKMVEVDTALKFNLGMR